MLFFSDRPFAGYDCDQRAQLLHHQSALLLPSHASGSSIYMHSCIHSGLLMVEWLVVLSPRAPSYILAHIFSYSFSLSSYTCYFWDVSDTDAYRSPDQPDPLWYPTSGWSSHYLELTCSCWGWPHLNSLKIHLETSKMGLDCLTRLHVKMIPKVTHLRFLTIKHTVIEASYL